VRADSARRRREERDARRAAGSGGDVEHDVVTATVAAELRRALSRLAPAQREVVELAYFGERSYRDVARELGLPEGTVKARVRAALSTLRHALAEREPTL
jgi:RNA polymerase sigma factor (sigma-70 family)